jgi:hypothetical protein
MTLAQTLNRDFRHRTLDDAMLAQALDQAAGQAGFTGWVRETRPHLFAPAPVFVSPANEGRIRALVADVEAVAALPAWRAQALAQAPATTAQGPTAPAGGGLFMGYDFHVNEDGPHLIEINTNAGGAALNLALRRAHAACCEAAQAMLADLVDPREIEAAFLQSLESEMRRFGRPGRPQSVAIVDDAPTEQYLYPEFLIFKSLFERQGIETVIADPTALEFIDGRLRHQGRAIDLVYNRLVDFPLAEPGHQALFQAWRSGAAVVSPDPLAHALFADKRNLVRLSDAGALAGLGVEPERASRIAERVPHTILVTADNAETLWAERKHWFFKPAAGHAGKAAWRGDKMTKRVWDEVKAGGAYVAQRLVPPPARLAGAESGDGPLKIDLRAYAYGGRVLMLAARLYQGQTTNFRTQGGGFAPVIAA